MSSQSLSVTFSRVCDGAQAADGCRISVEHDDLLNGGLSTFELGQTIYYKALPSGQYTVSSSNGGSGSVRSPNILAEITERITFNGGTTAALSHPLCGSFLSTWLGNAIRESDGAKVLPIVSAIKGSTEITVTEAVYGTISVTYGYCYTSLRFSPINAGEQTILFCRLCESTGEYVCESILETIEDKYYDDVTLSIVDACEGGPVAGAQVSVDGDLIETVSGEDGTIHVGLLVRGEHSIVVTAPGYVSSANDALSNDSILVE